MTLVDAFWKAIPKEMLNKMKSLDLKEGDTKDHMDEKLFECMDENSDGKVTFEEWHKAVISGALKKNLKVDMG